MKPKAGVMFLSVVIADRGRAVTRLEIQLAGTYESVELPFKRIFAPILVSSTAVDRR